MHTKDAQEPGDSSLRRFSHLGEGEVDAASFPGWARLQEAETRLDQHHSAGLHRWIHLQPEQQSLHRRLHGFTSITCNSWK